MTRRIGLVLLALVALLGTVGTADAAPVVFAAFLDGPSEDPPNASPGTGLALVTFDDVAHTLGIRASFSGLLGVTTAAHVHAPTAVPGTGLAGVATQTPFFAGFPIGVTSGVYDNTFDMTMDSTWSAGFLAANGGTAAGAEAAFGMFLAEGRAYFNIHTDLFPGGEIRGFLQVVPEPSTLLLSGIGALALTGYSLRCRRLSTTGA